MGAGLQGMVSRWIDDPELRWSLLVQAWNRAAGEALARHARPESFAEGVLSVHVEEPAWRHSVEEMEPELLARLQDAMGRRLVRGLRWLPED